MVCKNCGVVIPVMYEALGRCFQCDAATSPAAFSKTTKPTTCKKKKDGVALILPPPITPACLSDSKKEVWKG